jgi:hypothetical protein
LRRVVLLFVAALLAVVATDARPAAVPNAAPDGGALAGFRRIDATAASVNGEIVFLTDVTREACFDRCGAFPGESPDNVTMIEARKRLVYNRLVLQEQRKLALGAVDNEAFAVALSKASERMRACADPCAGNVGAGDIRAFVSDRFLVEGFLDKRVSVFIEVTDDEVQRELARRATAEGKDPEAYSEEDIRADLRREKSSLEVRNWYYKAASNARIFLSPMEEQ